MKINWKPSPAKVHFTVFLKHSFCVQFIHEWTIIMTVNYLENVSKFHVIVAWLYFSYIWRDFHKSVNFRGVLRPYIMYFSHMCLLTKTSFHTHTQFRISLTIRSGSTGMARFWLSNLFKEEKIIGSIPFFAPFT